MSPRPQTAAGLNQPDPVRLVDDLARKYQAMNRAALAVVLSDVLPAAVSKDRGRIAASLEKLQAATDDALPDNKIEREARKSGDQINANHRRLFFLAAAAVMRTKVIGTDAPGEELGMEEITSITPMAISPTEAIGPRGIGKTARVFQPPPGGRRILAAPRRVIPRINFEPEILADQFVDQNIRYISTLRDGVAEAVGDQVVREVVLGEGDPEKLAKRLAAEWRKKGVPGKIPTRRLKANGEPVFYSLDSHARMIAHDQISKLNAGLNRARQTAAGIDSFVWETQKDNRVRPAHRRLQGRRFTWDDGWNGVYPGEPVACRCWAKAVTDAKQMIPHFINVDDPEHRGTVFSERGRKGAQQLNPGPGSEL
mgnify:CR=1 FL=1